MSEHLRALMVLMFLGIGYFFVARSALLQLLPEETFKRWRNLWLVASLVLFLSHSLWLSLLLLGAMLVVYRRHETHLMGLYFVLLFVAPPAPAVISGLGIIDHVWVLDHYRLLGVTLLLPAAVSLFTRTTTPRVGSSPVDWMVVGYVLLMSLLTFREGNVTSGLRATLSLWIDIFLPYYVASRILKNEDDLKNAITGYLIAVMLLALIAIFEVVRSWKLYQAVLGALGVSEYLFGGYLARSGLMRPNASVGNSIVLGYLLVVGLGFFLYLKRFFLKPFHRVLGGVLLVGGIVASLSRGPWVGAVFLLITYALMSPNAFKRLGSLTLGGVVLFVILSQLPGGQVLIDMLPIVGSVEQGNVEYRANLLTSAMPVIGRNFLFGSHDFLAAPEFQALFQGDGIIDVVNTYVGVALYSGVVGLLLFLGTFSFTLHQIRQGIRIARQQDPRIAVLGRALFATVAAIMLIIYTVSSIGGIPVVYWSVLGLSVAYVGFMKAWSRETKAVSKT